MLHDVVPQTERKRCCLRLVNLMTFDSGNYTCVVFNRHGNLHHTYVLDVFCTYNIIQKFTREKDTTSFDLFCHATLC